MDLGKNKDDILNKGISIIKELQKKEGIQEGPTQIKTYINGIKTEIKLYVSNGKIMSFDMFKGWSGRDMGNTIYYKR